MVKQDGQGCFYFSSKKTSMIDTWFFTSFGFSCLASLVFTPSAKTWADSFSKTQQNLSFSFVIKRSPKPLLTNLDSMHTYLNFLRWFSCFFLVNSGVLMLDAVCMFPVYTKESSMRNRTELGLHTQALRPRRCLFSSFFFFNQRGQFYQQEGTCIRAQYCKDFFSSRISLSEEKGDSSVKIYDLAQNRWM